MRAKRTWAYRLCQAGAWLLYRTWYYPHGAWGWEWFAVSWYYCFSKSKAKALEAELFPDGKF